MSRARKRWRRLRPTSVEKLGEHSSEVERRVVDAEVAGSNPAARTIKFWKRFELVKPRCCNEDEESQQE